MKRLIVFLIRWKLGLKKYQHFRFTNQNSKTAFYYFTSENLIKSWHNTEYLSGVSLNWLLSNDCEIEKLDY